MTASISILPLQDKQAFLAEWTKLFSRAENNSFYLSPAWVDAWLTSAATVADIHWIVANENGHNQMMGVIGVGSRKPPLIGLQEVRLHETGEANLDDIYIEYNDFLTAADADPSLRQRMLAAIADNFAEADEFVFRNAKQPLVDAAKEYAQRSMLKFSQLSKQHTYAIDLAALREGEKQFLASLIGSFGAKLRRAIKGFEERAPLIGRIAPDQETAWNKMIDLHQASWRARRKSGAFDNNQLMSFHRRLREQAPEHCHLYEVTCGEDTIGVLYNFVHETRIMNYQSGFKLETDNKLTPGFVVHALACQYYADEGFDIYDMLAGDADYKERLGMQGEPLTSFVLRRPTTRNKARALIKSLGRRFS